MSKGSIRFLATETRDRDLQTRHTVLSEYEILKDANDSAQDLWAWPVTDLSLVMRSLQT